MPVFFSNLSFFSNTSKFELRSIFYSRANFRGLELSINGLRLVSAYVRKTATVIYYIYF
jgi:hypothetical protein